jgi:hypothetical protein
LKIEEVINRKEKRAEGRKEIYFNLLFKQVVATSFVSFVGLPKNRSAEI